MIPEETLLLVLSKLDQCGIPYMITGSFASNVHGVPRATQDADVIIEADQRALDRFLVSLGQEFYATTEALGTERMFNVVHLETGFKVDLIIRKSRPFSLTEFSRRQKTAFLGKARYFASAEDTILAKLEWARMGGSERQFDDAVNVAKIQGASLDREYLRRWAEDLKVSDLLDRLFQALP